MFFKVDCSFILPNYTVVVKNKFTGKLRYKKHKGHKVNYTTQYLIAKDKNEALQKTFQMFLLHIEQNPKTVVNEGSLWYELYSPWFFEKIKTYNILTKEIRCLPYLVTECTFNEVLNNFKFSEVIRNIE